VEWLAGHDPASATKSWSNTPEMRHFVRILSSRKKEVMHDIATPSTSGRCDVCRRDVEDVALTFR
jgi:hypothetical protein